MTRFVGIDPGASGGLAVIVPGVAVYAFPLPSTESEIHDLLVVHLLSLDPTIAVAIERVHAIPGVGSTSSSFTFGRGYGFLRGVIHALAASRGHMISFEDVPAKTWQAGLGISSKCQGSERKKRLCSIARQRFPGCSVTLSTCDALLIADWLRHREVTS